MPVSVLHAAVSSGTNATCQPLTAASDARLEYSRALLCYTGCHCGRTAGEEELLLMALGTVWREGIRQEMQAHGWPVLACRRCFLGGSQRFVIGLLGTYLAKIALEFKCRPVYRFQEARV